MRKTLAIILAIALLCIMAVGTTLTYFSDDDSDVNTMTVGKVGITQIDSNPSNTLRLYPVTATPTLQDPNNAVSKEVTVKLDANSENAYVRTIFAFEMKKVGDTWVNPIGTDVILVDNGITILNDVIFTKDGVQYVVGVCTYNNVLEANATTAPSLEQVYLAQNVGNEFSDAVGGSYEILVLSQAVQAQGFNDATTALNAAFGEVNASNAADWFANLPNN